VEAVLIGTDPDARADLIRDAKWHEQTLREASRGSRPKATGKARTAESPKDTSAYRAQAVGEYLALVAGQLPSVRRFRARALRGALVGLDHEANFLNSPAIRLLNRAGFSGELLT
jgi:hypothetical protein